MTKLKQFSTDFGVLYLRETTHGRGAVGRGSLMLTSSDAVFPAILGKRKLLQNVRRDNSETGCAWPGGRGCLNKACRSYFLE